LIVAIFIVFSDRKGPTPTLIVLQSSDRYLFGGYTEANWESHDEWKWSVDKSAYLFTLINPHKLLPTKYLIKSRGERAICSPEKFWADFW
jgi:hypothetical protein